MSRNLLSTVALTTALAACTTDFSLGPVGPAMGTFDPDDPGAAEDLAWAWIDEQDAMAGVDELEVRAVVIDELGMAHVRFDQRERGLPVLGGELVVHLDPSGEFSSESGQLARDLRVDPEPTLGEHVVDLVARLYESVYDDVSWDLLALRYGGEDHLAYRIRITDAARGAVPVLFVDAHTAELVFEYDDAQGAKRRATYTAANGTTLPGTLLRSEGQGAVGDEAADDAHDLTGAVYDYYLAEFGRDSWDGRGAAMISSVHYDNNLDNAYWNGSQMLYGDGGTYLQRFASSHDVVAHELTHAVTQTTAGLIYYVEAGALNEATSDILSTAAGAWAQGYAVDANTWKVGEDIVKPALGRDALRYMDDPTKDGVSRATYATRYVGGADNGGVHLNSGIANRWFYLVSTSGTLRIDEAADIWYRALTLYMTSTTMFFQARDATVQAATDLYGASSPKVAAVKTAWDAVGVKSVFDTGSWPF
jgi:vibriolysin